MLNGTRMRRKKNNRRTYWWIIGTVAVACVALCSKTAYANNGDSSPEGEGIVVITTAEPTQTPKPAAADLIIDSNNLYEGMARTYRQGYSPSMENGVVSIVLPLIATNPLANDTLMAGMNLGSVSGSPFVYGSYQQRVALSTQKINNGKDTIAAYYIRFDVALNDQRKNGVYPVEIDVTANDLAGNTIKKTFSVYVTIGDEKATPQPTDPPQQSSGSSGKNEMNNLIMIGKSRTQDAEQCRRWRTSDGEQSKKLAMDSLPDLRRKDKDKSVQVYRTD